jgi:histone-arginine methyltransferase CARM1
MNLSAHIGSGILSFLSAEAGASHVVSLEASTMSSKMSILVNSSNQGGPNAHFKSKIRVVRGMVEDEDVQAEVLKSGKVDTIISEPIGVMLLHERMVSRTAGTLCNID